MKRKEDYDKEEIQKKIKLAKEKLAAKTVVSIQQKIENSLKAQKEEEKMQKGGLKVAYHPALLAMNQGKYTSKYEKILPKHSDILANKKATVKVQENPYLTEKDSFRKRSREIKFNEPGKYIQIAEDKRNAEKLEALKKEIAETARKAGLERELELVSNKAIRDDEPPLVEWWDSKLISGETYDDFDYEDDALNELINNLVHHPIPIEPPGSDHKVEPKPLILTQKEQKKLRRQNRLEKQRDKQDRIRLGLLPPEEAKLTKSNFMRVLGHEAILAPSMVEAKMAQQVQERQQKHKELIESQKLTEEERREKKDRKLREDTSDLVHVAVFRISRLDHKPHLFKVNQNAKQYKLTGIAVLNKGLNLVVVEGGPKGIKAYSKLMLNRIKWDEISTEEGGLNECLLVWEGVISKRNFRNFRMKSLDSNLDAKAFLEDLGVVHYWTAARMHLNEEY